MQKVEDVEKARRQEAGRLLAQIVESSDDAIISKTLDGIITSWNSAAGRIFGYTADEAIGQHISILIPAERLNEEAQIVKKLKSGGNVDHYETVRRHKSGADIFVSLSVSPIRDVSGAIVGASKIARDITEKKRSEMRLQARNSELAHLGRLSSMGQMSAAIAHELNQPLTAIMNYVKAAQRMLEPGNFTPEKILGVREAMEKAAGQTLRAGVIIRHLREFVEKRDTAKDREDLNRMVEEAVALGFVNALESSVTVTMDLSPASLPVLIDKVQIQQVLLNLIRNGLEAMTHSVRREIMISTGLDEPGLVWVEIHDTGPGLPADIRAKLFQPFVTTKEKGMGIGLTICQSILEAHGGDIQLLPDRGVGASFRVTLPHALHANLERTGLE